MCKYMYVHSFMHAAEVNLAIEQKAQIRSLANIGLKKKKRNANNTSVKVVSVFLK